MEPAYMESFPHGNWTEIDDETWQQMLEEMNSTNVSLAPLQDQDFRFDDEKHAESGQSRTRRHSTDKDAATCLGFPASPPGCVTLSSSETSPEADSVPQAASGGKGKSTIEDLRDLVDQLRDECDSKARKLERLRLYIDDLQPWTAHINDLISNLMSRVDYLETGGAEGVDQVDGNNDWAFNQR